MTAMIPKPDTLKFIRHALKHILLHVQLCFFLELEFSEIPNLLVVVVVVAHIRVNTI